MYEDDFDLQGLLDAQEGYVQPTYDYSYEPEFDTSYYQSLFTPSDYTSLYGSNLDLGGLDLQGLLDLQPGYAPVTASLPSFSSPDDASALMLQLTGDPYLASQVRDTFAEQLKSEEDLLNRGAAMANLRVRPGMGVLNYSGLTPAFDSSGNRIENFSRSPMTEGSNVFINRYVDPETGGTIEVPEFKLRGSSYQSYYPDVQKAPYMDMYGVGQGDITDTYYIKDEQGNITGVLNPETGVVGSREPSTLEKIAGGLGGLAKAVFSSPTAQQAATKAAQGTTITRNPDGSITIGGSGQQQRQPSAAESVAKMAGLLYQLTKKDKTPVKARESTVQNIGPQYQAARPVRTLYAKGGKVELPESVGGGLLPIAMKIAEMLISQNGGEEEEMPHRKGLIGGEESGQEDNVEAMLSPGEYVIDAEIVSALGDGNTDAGAKKLDQMRYNIRKHKRNGGLAQIAPKAKSPEKYMKG